MKIALCGTNDESRSNLIKSFISQWPMYATPSEHIFNTTSWPEDKKFESLKDGLNEIEQALFAKILLLENQIEKFKDQSHIIYNGSMIDILVNALLLCEEGYVSDDFVEKVIYHNKKFLRDLDVIYYMPNNDITEESDAREQVIEGIYWNFYDNYQTDFNNSPFFDQKNCSSILILESNSPINEIKMLLDKNGNLDDTDKGGTDGDLINVDNLKKAFRGNPQLLNAAMESLKSGLAQNVGSIKI